MVSYAQPVTANLPGPFSCRRPSWDASPSSSMQMDITDLNQPTYELIQTPSPQSKPVNPLSTTSTTDSASRKPSQPDSSFANPFLRTFSKETAAELKNQLISAFPSTRATARNNTPAHSPSYEHCTHCKPVSQNSTPAPSRRPSLFSLSTRKGSSTSGPSRRPSFFSLRKVASNASSSSQPNSTISTPASSAPGSRRGSIFSRKKSNAAMAKKEWPAEDIDAVSPVSEEESVDEFVERGYMREFWGAMAATYDMNLGNERDSRRDYEATMW